MRKNKFFMLLLLFVSFLVSSVCNTHYLKAKSSTALNKEKVVIKVGQTTQLKVKDKKSGIEWNSKNKKIATVSENGEIWGHSVGKTTIVAKVDGKTYNCTVRVGKNSKVSKERAIAIMRKACGKDYGYFVETEKPVKYKGKKFWCVRWSEFIVDHFTTLTYYYISTDGTVCREGYSTDDSIVLY